MNGLPTPIVLTENSMLFWQSMTTNWFIIPFFIIKTQKKETFTKKLYNSGKE